MGVRGLKKLAKKHGTIAIVPRGATLHIDASGLMGVLLRGDRFEYGGAPHALEAALADFLLGLLDRGYACSVYRDGSGRRMKARTAAKRLAKRAEESFGAALAKKVFGAALDRLALLGDPRLTVVRCVEEADPEIARAAAADGGYVLGEDSDYLLFRDVNYVSLDDGRRLLDGKPVAVYTRAALAASLGLSEDVLVELALLLGNDYTGHFNAEDYAIEGLGEAAAVARRPGVVARGAHGRALARAAARDARRLDDDEADALAEMLERFPDRLLEAHLPPYWSDAQAAYRYQYAVAKSGIFDHVGTLVRPNAVRALFHGPTFHALRAGAAAPPPPPPPAAAAAALPIDAHRDEILRTIRENRVTIICGETGCGKSSRLPLMLLEADKKAKMFVSQPRRIAARSLCDRVRETKGGEVGLRLGHGERNETKRTRLWFCTTGYLVRLVASYPGALANHTHLIIDEVHERSVDTEILACSRRLVESHPSLKLVLMSATVCVDLYAGYFDVDVARAAIHVGARRYPVDIFYADDVAERLRLPRSAAGKLAQETAPSTPGRRDKTPNQSTQHKVVAEIVRAVGTAGRADVPFEDQLAVFSGAGAGTIRVILATNAAESGVTIPDCDHVIDLGLAKQIVYNAASHRSLLSQAWISKSSAVQRAGRTGRVRPGHVYRLYAKERYDALDEHATSEIHRCPLDATVLNLMTLSNATDLSAADMLAETVEPPSEAAVARSFAELHASGFIDSPDSDEAQLGMLGDATTLAAALSLPKSPWRIANPLVHDDPDEYAAIATASYLSRCRWDKGMHSEPVALVRLARAFDKTKNARAFCAAHNVVESRSRQLKHAAHAAREAATDCRRDAARLNRLRLLLVWTSGDAIFELARVKSPAATHRVAVTGAPLAPEQVAKLFPPGVDYAFASGVRRVYTMNGVPSDVDVTVEERAVAEVGSSLGFEGRLVDVAFCELAADVAYAVTARGLALFLTAAGRLAAGDLVARLVAKGAATTTLDVRRRDGADATTTSFVVVRKSHPSAGEKKDLKALLDALLARLFGAPEHARLDFKVQTPAAKQARRSAEPPADDALFEDLPLGARVLASVAAGHRREKLEALTCFGSDAWTRETLPVPVPEGALAACWDLADAYAAIGESLEPAPALVRQLDAIFGLEGAVPTRGADDEEEEEDDEEPRPSPATPAILARNGASPAKNGRRSPRTRAGPQERRAGRQERRAGAGAREEERRAREGRQEERGEARGRGRRAAPGVPGPKAKAVPPPPPPPKGDDSALSCCLVKLSLGDKPPRESWVEDASLRRVPRPARRATTSGRKLLRASRDAEIRAGWVEAGRRNLATGCVGAVDLGAASDAREAALHAPDGRGPPWMDPFDAREILYGPRGDLVDGETVEVVRLTWSGVHDVWRFPDEAAMDACDFTEAEELASTDSSSYVVDGQWRGDDGGSLYLGCSVSDHCSVGNQKLTLTYAEAPASAPTSKPTEAASTVKAPKCKKLKSEDECKANKKTCEWKKDKCKDKPSKSKTPKCKKLKSEDECKANKKTCEWKKDKCKDKPSKSKTPKCKKLKTEDECKANKKTCKWKGDKCKDK
ncbi:hypothetical protein JL722_4223 [Aureococcus anophagefferens]|nr:hypothetical protein JL722_4223 [Aureococcus anophagefferens]